MTTTTTTTRRAILAGAAAVPVTIAAPALASAPRTMADKTLRLLWEQYVVEWDATMAARDENIPYRDRRDALWDAIDPNLSWAQTCAERARIERENPDNGTWERFCERMEALVEIIRQIRAVPATSLYGGAIKLAAVPVNGLDVSTYVWERDMQDSAVLVLRDIDKLLKTDFAELFEDHGVIRLGEVVAAEDDDEGDGDEAAADGQAVQA